MPNTTAVRTAQVGAAPFFAGKNKIINGDFGVWQRGTSINLSDNTNTYTADRLRVNSQFSAGSSTLTQETFTAGTAPVAGYEGTYFARITAGSTASYFDLTQPIEDVRTFANQTATFSFWAKASISTGVTILAQQNFGSGGSSPVNTTTTTTITTSWERYTFTLSIPSIAGKTIGAGNFLNVGFYTTGSPGSSQTLDTWGWQVESGSVATAFQTATGTIQGELAACQRYFYAVTADGNNNGAAPITSHGTAASATVVEASLPIPVTMRTAPSLSVSSAISFRVYDNVNSAVVTTAMALGTVASQQNAVIVKATVASGLTQYRPYYVIPASALVSYIYLSAEL